MILTKFYDLISEELLAILKKNPSDKKLHQHKSIDQNKGYALLVWFLKFYGQQSIYKTFITEGDNDNSCDIIFSNKSTKDENIFYVVQSKHINLAKNKDNQYLKKGKLVTEKNFPQINKQEFGYALNDFNIILNSEKEGGKNKNFDKQYAKLKEHLSNNGKVKFIFFTLAQTNEEINDAVENFNTTYAPNVSLEIIDIKRIRKDYIEFQFKEVTTSNPLEYAYNSEDSTIELPIERLKNTKRDIFEFEGRTEAFTFLLKPKTIHALFKQYRFSLFFKNVRNPLHRSNYNQKIVDTLLKEPDSFWYFNNGITAITAILPDIGIHAENIKIEGLQIINGAQTVYSIYSAYENASLIEQKAMDKYAKISLRLIGSSNERFNLQITRYTNSQNPMLDRDFWANDAVQQKLQNESFQTDMWYEKRRGEFQISKEKQKELGISIIPNFKFISSYVAFHLQNPFYAIYRLDDFFVSRKEHENGLYEEIFNIHKAKFEDMYAASFVYASLLKMVNKVMKLEKKTNLTKEEQFGMLPALALSRIVMEKYFAKIRPQKDGKKMNLSRYLIELSKTKKEKDVVHLKKILKYSFTVLLSFLEKNTNDKKGAEKRFDKLMTTPNFYDVLVHKVEEEELDIKAIHAIDVNMFE
ncbi:MAG: AIPR family protein [Chitinophagales bacterium]